MRIDALPEGERPRERCLRLGPQALSASELLHLVLGGGSSAGNGFTMANSLLQRFGSLWALGQAAPAEMSCVPGIAHARSAALSAAFELGRRARRRVSPPGQIVASPADAAALLGPALENLQQEAILVLHLGGRHQLLRLQLVALGSLNAAAVEPREIFRGAIAVAAKAIVLAHNHPSGSPEPSEDDVRLTHRLQECGRTLGVPVLDHLVIAGERFVSLEERGLL